MHGLQKVDHKSNIFYTIDEVRQMSMENNIEKEKKTKLDEETLNRATRELFLERDLKHSIINDVVSAASYGRYTTTINTNGFFYFSLFTMLKQKLIDMDLIIKEPSGNYVFKKTGNQYDPTNFLCERIYQPVFTDLREEGYKIDIDEDSFKIGDSFEISWK